jgi:phage shock protein PspC (stress-responsive transcriptional regulator)
MVFLISLVISLLISLPVALICRKKGIRRTKKPDKMLGGVCGGLAKAWGITPSWPRLGFFFLGCVFYSIIFIYVFLWLFMAQEV